MIWDVFVSGCRNYRNVYQPCLLLNHQSSINNYITFFIVIRKTVNPTRSPGSQNIYCSVCKTQVKIIFKFIKNSNSFIHFLIYCFRFLTNNTIKHFYMKNIDSSSSLGISSTRALFHSFFSITQFVILQRLFNRIPIIHPWSAPPSGSCLEEFLVRHLSGSDWADTISNYCYMILSFHLYIVFVSLSVYWKF